MSTAAQEAAVATALHAQPGTLRDVTVYGGGPGQTVTVPGMSQPVTPKCSAMTVTAAAGLGVLNTVLMTTRDKVHDLGIFKALGMRPGQMLTMVVCQVAGPAIMAAAIAVPAGLALTRATVQSMGDAAHTDIPASFSQVLSPAQLMWLSAAPLAIAVAGALLPASWAARARPVTALRAE